MLRVNHLLSLLASPDASSAALRRGVALASSLGATLHVMTQEAGGELGLKTTLREIQERFGDRVVDVQIAPSLAEAKNPQSALQHYVEEEEVDLLVVDPPADRGPVPPMAATASKAIVEHLDRPTFFVGEARRTEGRSHILVVTDLSDRSFDVLRHAAELATDCDATVTLLHVVDASPYVALTPIDRLSLGRKSLSEQRARHRLEKFVRRAELADVSIHTRLAFGEPADRIVRCLNEGGIDLLVLGTHGAGAADPPLGHVADRVLRRVTCPVFLVRTAGWSLLSSEHEGETTNDNH